jgi:ABC-2 type transport system ATP-binding protein
LDSPVISIDQLTKYYGRTLGVRKLGFEVQAGEIFGFLGPNGAGKTTTIRILLGLLRPTSGRAAVFGLPVPDQSFEIRKRCGYLPGNFTGFANLTGAEMLRLSADLRQTSPCREEELIDQFKITAQNLGQKLKHLSHGTRQKLGIVQAFFHQPELIILDEPTTGLDPLMQQRFYDLLKETRAQGATIFFSSHNLPEIEKTCERVAIVRDGELVALETLENLKRKRYRRLQLTLSEPVDYLKITGAEVVNRRDLEYELLVKGDIDVVVKDLAKLPLQDMVLPEPDLEEVFMAYYRK